MLEAGSLKFEGVRNILVIKLRHIGDVLLTVPAIRALKETFPEARVSALVNEGTEDMLTNHPLLDEVITFKRSIKDLSIISRVAGEAGLVKELRSKAFDMAVDLTGGDRPALLGFSCGARYRLGYEPKKGFAGKRYLYTHLAQRPEIKTHTVLRDLGVVKAFGIDTRDLTVDIYTSKEDESFIDSILASELKPGERFVHAHPTSRWLFKCWPDGFMAQALDFIQSRGVRVILTSGPDEKELEKIKSITGRMKSAPVDLSGKLKLKHLACLSRKSVFFFGVDSAPMHIAAAAGAKVVSIFGPSGAFDWGPWDNKAAVDFACAIGEACNTPYPFGGGVQRFGKNTVIQMSAWTCIPCGQDGCEGSKRSDCLEDLAPEEVIKIISAELDSEAGRGGVS